MLRVLLPPSLEDLEHRHCTILPLPLLVLPAQRELRRASIFAGHAR
jgi:hypothetical protein